jgi:shikimate dehydrogenase
VEIGAKTRVLAVLGDPVAHSLSPALHNAAIRALGLDAIYVALRVPADDFSIALPALAVAGVSGNVTIPHKEAAERCVMRKTDQCVRGGACNTFWMVREGKHHVLVGDNTDVPAIGAAVAELVPDAARWLVLGTGGTARAVAIAAADAGVELLVRSRDPARARSFVEWAEGRGTRATIATALEADVVINATPLGLAPKDPLPIKPTEVKGVRAALDMVYAAGETVWVQAWRKRGDVLAVDGRGVLVRQAALAFTRFFPGLAAPIEVMKAAVERALSA